VPVHFARGRGYFFDLGCSLAIACSLHTPVFRIESSERHFYRRPQSADSVAGIFNRGEPQPRPTIEAGNSLKDCLSSPCSKVPFALVRLVFFFRDLLLPVFFSSLVRSCHGSIGQKLRLSGPTRDRDFGGDLMDRQPKSSRELSSFHRLLAPPSIRA
jgi:hypothetical protein